MIRIVTSGIARRASDDPTLSVLKERTEPSRRTTVRPFGRGSGVPTRPVSKPSRAKARAAVRPEGPSPTTRISSS